MQYTGHCLTGGCTLCISCWRDNHQDDGTSFRHYIGSGSARQRGIQWTLRRWNLWTQDHCLPSLVHTSGWGCFALPTSGAHECNACAMYRLQPAARTEFNRYVESGEGIAAERANSDLQPVAPWREHLIQHGGINRSCSLCSEPGGSGRRLFAFSCCNNDRLHPRLDQLVCIDCAQQMFETSGDCCFCRRLGFCGGGHNSRCRPEGNESQARACERAACTEASVTCNICLEHEHTHSGPCLDLPEVEEDCHEIEEPHPEDCSCDECVDWE